MGIMCPTPEVSGSVTDLWEQPGQCFSGTPFGPSETSVSYPDGSSVASPERVSKESRTLTTEK